MNHVSTSSVRSTQGVWMCLALVFFLVQVISSSPAPSHHLTKRSFFDIQCKGVYDKSIFARLDRICEDCYDLFREPQIHTLCRSECFSTDFFKGCIEALLLSEEMDKFNKMVEYLGR